MQSSLLVVTLCLWVLLRVVFDYLAMFSAGLPSSVRLCFGQPCSPCESGRFRRPSPHSAYTYTPSGASPAVIVSLSKVPPGFGPKQSRAWHPRVLGPGDACSSLPSGKSSTPPARCIHHSRHDASSAGYRLLASFAPGVASREPESRRSPAHAPRTRRLDPTFHYSAFFFVASALANVPSARLTLSASDLPCVFAGFAGKSGNGMGYS